MIFKEIRSQVSEFFASTYFLFGTEDALTPYEHYIPIDYDATNILDRILWARSHDEECQKIAQNATEFAENNLTSEHNLLYFYRLLKAYEALQDFGEKELLEDTLNNPDWVCIDAML